jgi:hypothetical protein
VRHGREWVFPCINKAIAERDSRCAALALFRTPWSKLPICHHKASMHNSGRHLQLTSDEEQLIYYGVYSVHSFASASPCCLLQHRENHLSRAQRGTYPGRTSDPRRPQARNSLPPTMVPENTHSSRISYEILEIWSSILVSATRTTRRPKIRSPSLLGGNRKVDVLLLRDE